MSNPYLFAYITILIFFVIIVIFSSLSYFNKNLLNKISLKFKLFFYLSLILSLLQMLVILILIYTNKFFVFKGFYFYVFSFFLIEWVIIYLIILTIFKNLNKIIKLMTINFAKKIEYFKSKSLESSLLLNYANDVYSDILERKFKLKNYLCFIPKSYYDLVYKENSVNSEKYKAILVVDIRSSSYLSETLSLTQNYESLSNYMNLVCNIIYNNNGLIDGFAGDGLLCLFNNSQDALMAAKQIMSQKILKDRVGIALHYGKVKICELGNNLRKTITAISNEINKTFKIEKINKKIGSKVVFTKEFLNNLPKNVDENYRYIGVFSIDDKLKLPLFECFMQFLADNKYILAFENCIRQIEKGNKNKAQNELKLLKKQQKNDNVLNFYINYL